MLFRTLTGQLVEIKRSDYANDAEYHKHIGMIFGVHPPKEPTLITTMLNLITSSK